MGCLGTNDIKPKPGSASKLIQGTSWVRKKNSRRRRGNFWW